MSSPTLQFAKLQPKSVTEQNRRRKRKASRIKKDLLIMKTEADNVLATVNQNNEGFFRKLWKKTVATWLDYKNIILLLFVISVVFFICQNANISRSIVQGKTSLLKVVESSAEIQSRLKELVKYWGINKDEILSWLEEVIRYIKYELLPKIDILEYIPVNATLNPYMVFIKNFKSVWSKYKRVDNFFTYIYANNDTLNDKEKISTIDDEVDFYFQRQRQSRSPVRKQRSSIRSIRSIRRTSTKK